MTYIRKKFCDTGKYDWKLFLPSIILALALSLCALKTYSSAKYWCAAVPNTITIPLFSFIVTLLVLFICLFCYIQTIREIRANKKQQLRHFGSQDTSRYSLNDIEIKVSIKVLGYILVYIIQWIPTVIYDLYQYFGNVHPWVYCMVAISINMGPIGNMIFFIINEEGRRYDKSSNYSSAYDHVKGGNADSNNNTITISIENKSLEIDFNHF
ncbi:3427_t:CDS:2 [Gigaspora margarita]|uniref:3427_t:CDS:1 n=1 Tax=Gigaspora margarita TaxID=4874 RepID=A0ABN7W5E5_GIGMA|nr:3427_t:CDS:2 [Gigaspora margarita]